MTNEINSSGKSAVILQHIDTIAGKLILNLDGEIREIHSQLSDLKALLATTQTQKIQYAEKIYNIEHINEANFGFLVGKKAFNAHLSKVLMVAMPEQVVAARRFLEKVSTIPDWEHQLHISARAKEIISYSFVGVIGIQLSRLIAIGKEDLSEVKQRKYIEKCVQISKRSLELVSFMLLSKLWDAQRERKRSFSETEKQLLANRFEGVFEPNISDSFQFLKALFEIFSNPDYQLKEPIEEMTKLKELCQTDSPFHTTCKALHELNQKLDRAQYDLLTCYEAETQLATFLEYFIFLVNYRMASIKHIGFRQSRNTDPGYLHRYAALGIDSKANIDAEKMKYTSQTVETDSVLLYRGPNYEQSINLFPFVIDYNALTFEHGSKICFFRAVDLMDENLEFLFLEDHSTIRIKWEGIKKEDTDLNELMLSKENQRTLNLDHVVDQFRAAKASFLQ